MVQQCSTTDNAATTTPVATTTRHLQQVQERTQGNGNYRDKTRKTPIVHATELMTSNSFQLERQISIKMTSSDLGNGLGNKTSMLRSDRQMFVAPGDGDPFNPMRHFSGSRNPSCPPQNDDVSNDGFDADNDDNDNASFSENDAISSSEDEDLHNPQRPYNFNRAFGESGPATEIA
ncbi:hypothetical protein Cgig2_027006 [Carnegiea gigantea]|uniref:Uncharacterized protein n=1 Tax=Carnegiea gigantea TaxID=171969 RepID=A0A9Q1JW50_9CARY|nr:hypothetical protein Cgig2_027006 [Carnegiea gigantea]